MEPEKKMARRNAQKRSYIDMEPHEKGDYLENKAHQYKSMEPKKKEAFLENKAEQYHSMEPEEKKASCDAANQAAKQRYGYMNANDKRRMFFRPFEKISWFIISARINFS